MRSIVVVVAFSACALLIALGAPGSETESRPTMMLSRLKVGQQVRLVRFPNGGGYNVELPNDKYIKNFERGKRQKYVVSKITEIGSDFIAVTSPDGTETTVAARLIEVITKLPEIKAEADEAPGK
jgi:hypothetical protein